MPVKDEKIHCRFILYFYVASDRKGFLSLMLDENDDASDVPVISLPHEVYDAVLLADAVMLVTEQGAPSATLQEFFKVRRCLLTCASGRRQLMTDPELMFRMVGG
jgi:hypothetical protein